MAGSTKKSKITIDGVDYAIENMSASAKSQIANIQFSDEQILQLQNEWAISNTARSGYLSALKSELAKVQDAGS